MSLGGQHQGNFWFCFLSSFALCSVILSIDALVTVTANSTFSRFKEILSKQKENEKTFVIGDLILLISVYDEDDLKVTSMRKSFG